MKKELIKELITFVVELCVILVLSACVGRAFGKIADSGTVFGIAFLCLLCLYYQIMAMLYDYGPSYAFVDKCCTWYADNLGDTAGYFVIFFLHVTAAAFVCFVFSFSVTAVFAPVSYNVERFRRLFGGGSSIGMGTPKGNAPKRNGAKKPSDQRDWRYGISQ